MQPPKEQHVCSQNGSALAKQIKALNAHLGKDGVVQGRARTTTEPTACIKALDALPVTDADEIGSVQRLAVVILSIALLCQLLHSTPQHVHLL